MKCKHCDKDLIGLSSRQQQGHTMWCDPIRAAAYRDKLSKASKKNWSDGKLKSVPHTEETKKVLSEKARASTHRRLLKSCRYYVRKDGSIVKLDSSWEEALARRLDELDIEWERPDPFKWVDSDGRARNYFPDFWLPQYKIYLDPKNPAAFAQQKEKIKWLQENRKDVYFIRTLEECKNFFPR